MKRIANPQIQHGRIANPPERKETIKQLQTTNITSDVFIISPAQLEYIANVFSKNFADAMNMRTFSVRICEIARESLRTALKEAKKMGERR